MGTYVEKSGAGGVTLATTDHQQGVLKQSGVDSANMSVRFSNGPLFRAVFLLPLLHLSMLSIFANTL